MTPQYAQEAFNGTRQFLEGYHYQDIFGASPRWSSYTGIICAHSGNAEEVLPVKLRQNSIRQHKAAIKGRVVPEISA